MNDDYFELAIAQVMIEEMREILNKPNSSDSVGYDFAQRELDAHSFAQRELDHWLHVERQLLDKVYNTQPL